LSNSTDLWNSVRPGTDLNYVLVPGDHLLLIYIRFFHGTSYSQFLDAERRQRIEMISEDCRKLFEEAGFTDVSVEPAEIPERLQALHRAEVEARPRAEGSDDNLAEAYLPDTQEPVC